MLDLTFWGLQWSPYSPWLVVARIADDQRRLDLLIHGATARGEALACDVTLVSPLGRAGNSVHQASDVVTAAAIRKRRRYPELVAGGPQRLLVLGAELGGRWHPDSIPLLRMLTALRRLRAPPRATAAAGWAHRWWCLLSTAAQRAAATTALGEDWITPTLPRTPPPPEHSGGRPRNGPQPPPLASAPLGHASPKGGTAREDTRTEPEKVRRKKKITPLLKRPWGNQLQKGAGSGLWPKT